MNKKAITPITVIFWFAMAAFAYIFLFASIITQFLEMAVVNGGLTGIEAFVYTQFNFIIAIIYFIALFAVMYTVSA